MERLRCLVDEAVDTTALIKAEGRSVVPKQWSDNMERLRGLVDEAVDTTALIKAEGRSVVP